MDEEEELDNTLIGQEEEVTPIGAEDAMMGGLGLGGAAFAAQTGRAPAPRPMVPSGSELAQRVAANDAARLAAQNRPVLIGTGTSTSGVTNPRLVPGTSIVPTGQPPAVTSTGGPPATTGGTLTTTTAGGQTGGGQPRLTGSTRPSADDFDFRINPARASRLARFGGPGALIYGAADLGLEALTGRGLSERIGEGVGGAVGNLLYPGAQSLPPLTAEEISQYKLGLRPGAYLDMLYEDIEADKKPLTDVTPLEAGIGALNKEIAERQGNLTEEKVDIAKEIQNLGTVSDDQRAVQDFMDERAERAGETPTDVITPFQEQAELTADLFTDPDTEIGQFVPRATFTLPDGTIIQEDEGGNRREISAEQLRQFEQDMAGLGQPSVMGLGRGGDAGVIKSFDRPMGPEETQAALGGRTLNEYLNAPDRTSGVPGLRTDAQGRMITPAPQPAAPQAPSVQAGPAKVPDEIMSQVVRTGGQTAEFRDANGDGIEDREQGIFKPGELLGYDAQGNEVRAPGTQPPVNRGAGTPASPGATTNQLSPFELASLDRQLRMGGTGSFEGDSALREAKLRGRPDFNEVRRDSDRTGGGLSQADARDLVQGSAKGATEGERMRALQIQSRLGLGEFKPQQTDLQEQYTRSRIAVMDAQLAQSGIVPSAPPVVDPVTGVITQKYNDGTIRFKGVARNPNTGVIDPDFTGFLPEGEGDQSSKFKTGEIREQEIDGQTYRFQFDGEKWNQI